MPRPSGIRHSPRRASSSGRTPLTRRPAIEHVARGRRVQPGRDPQRRGLPGAVRAEQRDDARLGDLEVDAEQDVDALVGGVDVAELEEVHVVPAALPRYAASTASFCWISAGLPTAMIWPKSSTCTVWQTSSRAARRARRGRRPCPPAASSCSSAGELRRSRSRPGRKPARRAAAPRAWSRASGRARPAGTGRWGARRPARRRWRAGRSGR